MKRYAFALLGLVAAFSSMADSQVRKPGGTVVYRPPPPPPPPPTPTDLTGTKFPSAPHFPPADRTQAGEGQITGTQPAPEPGSNVTATPESVVAPPPEPPPEPPPSDGECDDGDLNVLSNPNDCVTSEVPPPIGEQGGSGFSWWYVVIGLAAGFLLSRLYRMVRRR